MDTDRSWLMMARDDERYKKGIREFMEFVRSKGATGETLHVCPCRMCRLTERLSLDDVYWHLIEKGMKNDYTLWYEHGEVSHETSIYQLRQEYVTERRRQLTSSSSYCTGSSSNVQSQTTNNPTMEMIQDAFNFGIPSLPAGSDSNPFQSGGSHEADHQTNGVDGNLGNVAFEKYKRLVAAAQTPISEASEQTVLSYIIDLMSGKIKNRWSDKSINDQLAMSRALLPKENKLPNTYREVKKILNNLGMEYINIHACVHGCSLYYKEFAGLDRCPVCNSPRYEQCDGKKKRRANKVVKYFPLGPRLRRLYMSPNIAKEMRWHAERDVSSEGMLRHPADGEAWKDFDKAFPDFASDIRNVRLALSTDGFNPFGAPNIKHSTWPVMITPLNLPPSMCMRKEFNILAMLISGPLSPGKCLSVYMRPLMDELATLWTDGIPTYDRHGCSSFKLRAAVLWTISDFPGLGMLAGHKVKSFRGCPICLDDITSEQLGDRTCYMGHRRWLAEEHHWREQADKFDGRMERRNPPRSLSGPEILAEIDSHNYHTLTNHPALRPKPAAADYVCWSHKTSLYTLPYWESIAQPYSLDVMHIEKNVFDNLIGTILGIESKTKDGPKARAALKELGVRQEQWLPDEHSSTKKVLKSPFTVTREQRREILEWIRDTKYPHGYAGSLKNKINVEVTDFSGLKTHDCHVILQRLIPVVIRPYLPSHVVIPIVRLSKWFQDICCRELRVEDIVRLKKEIVTILCRLERIFPPTFFTIMVHLLIHLPDQILLKGPVHYSWMYPIERQLGEYKKSVRNKRFPEGCIAEQYILQECVTYCQIYLDEKPIIDAPTANVHFAISVTSNLVKAGGVIRKLKLSYTELELAHWCVIENCPEASYFVTKHREKWYTDFPYGTSEDCRRNFVKSYFLPWISSLGKKTPRSSYWKHELYLLACEPQMHSCHTHCLVNGIKFVVIERDTNLLTQNSGVMVEAGEDEVYYGVIEQIILLKYTDGMEVVLFKCRWFNSSLSGEDGSVKMDHGLVSVDTSANWYADSPYCLALAAKQVYFLDDPKLGESWKVVNKVSHNGVYSDACLGRTAAGPCESSDDPDPPEPYQEFNPS